MYSFRAFAFSDGFIVVEAFPSSFIHSQRPPVRVTGVIINNIIFRVSGCSAGAGATPGLPAPLIRISLLLI